MLKELDSTRFDDAFKALVQRIQGDNDARAGWISDCNEVRKLIDGKDKRLKKPWPWASELSIPLLKKLLRSWKPMLYNLVAAANPVASFRAGTGAAAQRTGVCEDWFSWLVREHMTDTLSEFQYMLDAVGGDRGMGYLVASWDYLTELESRVIVVANLWPDGPPNDVEAIVRTIVEQYDLQGIDESQLKQLITAAAEIISGAPYVKVTYRRTISDRPKLQYFDPFRVIVPINSGYPEAADYVCLMHDFTPSELRQGALDGHYNAEAVNKLLEKIESPSKGNLHNQIKAVTDTQDGDQVKLQQQIDAGINGIQDDGTIRVYQVYVKLDINSDGIDERCVLWYCPWDQSILALFEYPFSFHYWPVFRFDYEKVDRRPYISRGIGHILRDIQKELNGLHRGMMDAVDIELSPTFQMRMTAGIDPKAVRFGPGAVIPVQQVGDIGPIQTPQLNLPAYLQTKGELQGFGEETIGSVNSALAATGRNLERRTAFEVQKVSGAIDAIQTMDAAAFQTTCQKLWQCIWEMWLDLGPEEVFFQVTGEEMPRPFKKSEHNYHYQLVPAGTPGNTNRQAEMGKAMQMLELALKLPPDILDLRVVARYTFALIDRRLANMAMMTQEQGQEQQILRQAATMMGTGKGVTPDMQAMMGRGRLAGGGPAQAGS